MSYKINIVSRYFNEDHADKNSRMLALVVFELSLTINYPPFIGLEINWWSRDKDILDDEICNKIEKICYDPTTEETTVYCALSCDDLELDKIKMFDIEKGNEVLEILRKATFGITAAAS